jgi:hypothetical protein
MSINTDTKVLIDLLDPPPEIPHHEAMKLIREHIRPSRIRWLRRNLEAIKHDEATLEYARERGPEWLASKEGDLWLREQARQRMH